MSTKSESPIKGVMKRLERNAEMDEFFSMQLDDAGYGGVDIQRTPLGTRITIFVNRPGLVIGRRGVGIRTLTDTVAEKFGLPNPTISVTEIEQPDLDPRIVSGRIVHTISRGIAFRRAAQFAKNAVMRAGALGVEIEIKGKLRSERARYEKFREGILPKSGDTAKRMVRKATKHLQGKMGLSGVTVSIAIKDALPEEFRLLEPKMTKTTDDKGEEIKITEDKIE